MVRTVTTESLPRPDQALEPEDLQRFYYACAHERRSPMTMRMIDAASYGWIHLFIQTQDVSDQSNPEWASPGTADPRKLEGFFERVAIRLRETSGHDYARRLEAHYKEIADSTEVWPSL